MSSIEASGRKLSRTPALGSLTDARRRRILALLLDRPGPVTERSLASAVAAREAGDREAPREEVRTVRVDLRHRHLPKLDEAGLIAWDRAEDRVAASDHPAFDDPRFRRMVELDDDRLVEALADDRRRTVLSVLESRDRPLARRRLAREVATAGTDGEPSAEAVTETAVELHHVHLPKLAEAGLVEYDPDEETVAYRGLPERAGADLLEFGTRR